MDNKIVNISNGFIDHSQSIVNNLENIVIQNSNNYEPTSENQLFLSLKFHIDTQFKRNQLNHRRIRSFERFRKYCQRIICSIDGSIGYDPEQFQNEYNRFDRNYRHWKKRVGKLRNETKFSLLTRYQNPYNTLHELFTKIENNENPKSSINTHDNCKVIYNCRTTQDQSIQCEFTNIFNGPGEKFTTKRPRGRPSKATKCALNISESLLSTDLICPNTSLNLIRQSSKINCLQNVPVNHNCEQNCNKLNSTTVLLKRSKVSGDPECPDQLKTKQRGRPKQSKVYHCDYEGCRYSSPNSSSLKMHTRTHTNERPFKCDKCEFAFKNKCDLKEHEVKHEGKRFWCSFEGCQVNYATTKRLRKHVRFFHTTEIPLLHCDRDDCQYSTRNPEYMTTHRRNHTRDLRYKCPECGLAFKTDKILCLHQLATHKDKDSILKCDFEGCAFITNRNSILRSHKVCHSDKRPYTCPWPGCDDSFKTRSALTSHKLAHENLRQYKCIRGGCNFSCNLSSNLRRHVEQVHENKKRRVAKKPKEEPTLNLDSNREIKAGSSLESSNIQ